MKVSTSWGPRNTGAKFNINAPDLESALSVMEGQDEWGRFQGDIGYDSKGDADGNVTSVVLKPTYTITMPNWPNAAKQPKTCKAEWDRMVAALRKHENGHLDRFLKGLAKLEAEIKAMKSATHEDIDTALQKALGSIQSAHDSYDSSTKNGQTEGVSLTIKEECEAM